MKVGEGGGGPGFMRLQRGFLSWEGSYDGDMTLAMMRREGGSPVGQSFAQVDTSTCHSISIRATPINASIP